MEAKEQIEKLSEEIHKLYCDQYLLDNKKPYWTNGDYSKLDERTKEYDRNIARWHLESLYNPPQDDKEEGLTKSDLEGLHKDYIESRKAKEAVYDFYKKGFNFYN